MNILSIDNPVFKSYGRVIIGYDVLPILQVLNEKTPLPQGTDYVPEQKDLQTLPLTVEIRDGVFGGMPIQMGWCNGHNSKLNCLEYHRDSEINLSTDDFILLLGLRSQIDENGLFDTADVKAFLVPAGTMVEVYATSLHYAPCSAKPGAGFRVLVVLPKGTNTKKPVFKHVTREDDYMTARNKWLLAHKDSAEAKSGAKIGLRGKNIDLYQ